MDTIIERYKEYRRAWPGELEDLFAYIGYRFGRREMRERALDYLIGLLSTIERKNGWQLAEATAHAAPRQRPASAGPCPLGLRRAA